MIKEEQYLYVLKKIPTLKNVDGRIIDDQILDKVKAMPD